MPPSLFFPPLLPSVVLDRYYLVNHLGFPGGAVVKNPCASLGDSIPGLGRFPGVGNGNPLQYSCLETFMDRGAWQATIHGVTNS